MGDAACLGEEPFGGVAFGVGEAQADEFIGDGVQNADAEFGVGVVAGDLVEVGAGDGAGLGEALVQFGGPPSAGSMNIRQVAGEASTASRSPARAPVKGSWPRTSMRSNAIGDSRAPRDRRREPAARGLSEAGVTVGHEDLRGDVDLDGSTASGVFAVDQAPSARVDNVHGHYS